MVRTINRNIRKWLKLPKRPCSADFQQSERRICLKPGQEKFKYIETHGTLK